MFITTLAAVFIPAVCQEARGKNPTRRPPKKSGVEEYSAIRG